MVNIGNGFSHGELRWLPAAPVPQSHLDKLSGSELRCSNASEEKTPPLSGVGTDALLGTPRKLYMIPFNTCADINCPAEIPLSKIHISGNCDKDHHYPVADVKRPLLRSPEGCSFPYP